MAQAPQSPGGNDNFIRRIVTDPKNVPDVMLLTGYLGASSEEDHERLYLSPDLSNYVEIPKAAILHQAPLPKEQDAHGGVTVWVKKDAALQYKMAPAAQALANYFAGAIQAGMQGAPGAAAAGPHVTIGVCGHATQHCPTLNCSLHCATEITPCINTHANTCYCPVTHGCSTLNQLCQSQGACTYVGCGASLACTQGLLCGGVAAAAAPQVAQAQAGFAGQANLQPSFVDCSIVCPTRFGPCQSHHFTCAPCVTLHPLQCTIGCTQPPHCILETVGPPCLTRNVVQCSFVCTQPGQCLQSVGAACVTQHPAQCSIACPTQFVTCGPACQITHNPALCPVVSAPAACPPVSLACPQQSLACGGFPGQQGFGGQAMQPQGFGGQAMQPQGFEWSVMCTIRCWHTGRACWV
jgi:hypothetical protein